MILSIFFSLRIFKIFFIKLTSIKRVLKLVCLITVLILVYVTALKFVKTWFATVKMFYPECIISQPSSLLVQQK